MAFQKGNNSSWSWCNFVMGRHHSGKANSSWPSCTSNDVSNMRCAQAGEPLALLMRGVNLYTGGHYDEYDATFFDYKARPACVSVT
jgi:hypothetical protein